MNLLGGLDAHAHRLAGATLATLLGQDPARAADFSLRVGPLYANFARQRYDRAALDALFGIAEEAGLDAAMRRLLDGAIVNPTEHRAALHSALRGDASAAQPAIEARAQAVSAQARMRELIDALATTGVTDIVSVGIGGSDLGPRLMVDALALPGARFKVHFISNVDGNAAQRVLAGLDPSRSAAIVISKTFGTQETLLNGGIVRAWLGDDARLYAVSTNAERVAAFGVPPERTLPMWDWVGGRYSLWSAVGFPIALAIGMDRFLELLDGAAAMDAHAADAAPRENLAIWHALTAVWNRNALHAATQAVLPYDDRLKLLPAYLQQLVMESLGKSVTLSGDAVDVDTVPVWWG
ncbi:MAG: glucose-6-phosphate isomerase, partial [Lysobacteraceae bacterium]